MSIENPVKGEWQRGPDLTAAGVLGNFSKSHKYIYGACACGDKKWVQYRANQTSPDRNGNRECNRCRIKRQAKMLPDSRNYTPMGADPGRVVPKRGWRG